MLVKQRRWLKQTRMASENTKAKDRKDEHRHNRLGKSSDGRAKTHQSREEQKVGRSRLAFDEAVGYLYAKLTRDSTRQLF